METVLEVRELTKRYRNGRGVSNVSFDVRRGDIFGLLGPNGSGKTTVLKLITRLCAADRGTVRLFGQGEGDRFDMAMRKVGCIVESADVYDFLSGREHMKQVARFYPGLPESRIDEALEWVKLAPYAREKTRGYSLGMKMRLALATALLPDPELVILDEPANGLDIEGTVELRELIVRLSEQRGTTFVISSHRIDEMERICNRAALLYGGTVIREGAVSELTAGGMSLEQAYLAEIRAAKGGGAHASSIREHAQ
jgi:ABC-2 type transport system ATP-binding protein